MNLKNAVKKLCIPFLRRTSLFINLALSNVQPKIYVNTNDEFTLLCSQLNITEDNICTAAQSLAVYIQQWSTGLLLKGNNIIDLSPPQSINLVKLPHLYQDLVHQLINSSCADCGLIINDPVLCLTCGKVLRKGKGCCSTENKNLGECFKHSIICNGGQGLFLVIKASMILLLHDERVCYWSSPYLDTRGEEDPLLKRGKPLYLDEQRYTQLRAMILALQIDEQILNPTTAEKFAQRNATDL